jgi:hypothetical protein
MTIKRAKNVWHHQAPHNVYAKRHKDALASSYLSAAMTALIFAIVVILIGIAAIGDSVESYFNEKPMINIVIPQQDIR